MESNFKFAILLCGVCMFLSILLVAAAGDDKILNTIGFVSFAIHMYHAVYILRLHDGEG